MPADLMQSPSRLLDYLPAIYRDDLFLGQFLKAFEDVLLGSANPTRPGLEEIISNIYRYFDPQDSTTSQEFLEWLAGWTALSLRADLSLVQQRDFVANIIPLYRRRGTKDNLIQLLKIFTIGEPVIREASAGLQIGVRSTIGQDTYLGSSLPPHVFEITIILPTTDSNELERQKAIAHALIELEKPAHTYYDPKLAFTPSEPMQIGVHSTVGVDTILGIAPSI